MDKLLIISGGSSGIGAAALERFHLAGYRAINLSRSPANPAHATHIATDFADPEWAERTVQKLHSAVGHPQQLVLIHNAALLVKDSVATAKDLGRVLQVNLIAPQQLNELLLPLMPAGSSILYVGSTLSEKAVANTLSYCVSKHGLLGLMRATCQDLRGKGIHTACVCPGFTDTEMLRHHVGNDAEILHSLERTTAFGRLVQPQEIAEALFFCASNPASNGTALHVNLGQLEI